MDEKTVERELVKRVKEEGGIAYKFSSPGRRSVPDRLCLFPGGKILFVECKRPGGKVTKPQAREHERLRQMGFDVVIIDNKKDADVLIK